MTRSDMKQKAREQIKPIIGVLIGITLLAEVIYFALSYCTKTFPSLVQSLCSLMIISPLEFGLVLLYLNVTKGKESKVSDLFKGFSFYWKVIELRFLTGLFIFLWSLLFVIPGMIKAISYSQAPYILAEHPEMSPLDAITESRMMMDGYKLDYFILRFSFIGWMLLGLVTCGIGFLYLFLIKRFNRFIMPLISGMVAEPP